VALPACQHPANPSGARCSSMTPFLDETRFARAIVEPLPVVDTMAIDIEEVSHTGVEASSDYLGCHIVSSLPHAHRNTGNCFLGRGKRQKERDHNIHDANP
jgi:hypothetical protein